jgi:hypothetical protein
MTRKIRRPNFDVECETPHLARNFEFLNCMTLVTYSPIIGSFSAFKLFVIFIDPVTGKTPVAILQSANMTEFPLFLTVQIPEFLLYFRHTLFCGFYPVSCYNPLATTISTLYLSIQHAVTSLVFGRTLQIQSSLGNPALYEKFITLFYM